MNFNSYIFILAFLPLSIITYFLLGLAKKPKISKAWLILLSLGFVTYADWRFTVFLVISMAVNFAMAKFVVGRRWLLTLGIVLNCFFLGYSKYTMFGMDILYNLFNLELTVSTILVPLGISFITFQQIMYLVDVSREKITDVNPLDYAVYVTFFPKMVQGPITKYDTLLNSFDDDNVYNPQSENLACGLCFFMTGLARKVLLADIFAKGANYGFGNVNGASSLQLVLVSLCYTLQIYFDFSGYCKMGIGVAKMLNINLSDNFDRPYTALSINDFWKKWHISLTDFLREYIYFPLGGSRKGTIRTYINILIIFFISGIWHGAAWTFVVWGLLHGVAQCLNRLFDKQWNKIFPAVRWILTFSFVNLAWVFFRASTVGNAWNLIRNMFTAGGMYLSEEFIQCFEFSEIVLITNRCEVIAEWVTNHAYYSLIGYFAVAFALIFTIKDRVPQKFKPTVWKAIYSGILFFWSVISLSTVVEFIYGGF